MKFLENGMALRGIVYCIHLVGVGHMKRMLALCEKLLEYAEITFIQGGIEVGLTIQHPNFTHVRLPQIQEMLDINIFGVKGGIAAAKAKMKIRKNILFNSFDPLLKYDFVITEQIPFSKLFWLNEVLSIVALAKQKNPEALIVCSHKGTTRNRRENLNESSLKKCISSDRITAKIIKKYYDLVLVHSDAKLIPLEENFFETDAIRNKVVYTGYISKPLKKALPIERSKKDILITLGAGPKCEIFMRPLISAIEGIPEYNFIFVKGPMLSKDKREFLKEADIALPNLQTVEFMDDIDDKLSHCKMAILTAGFTLINSYATKTPALVFPDDREGSQMLIAERFSEHGFVRAAEIQDINPERLREIIREMEENPPKPDFDLNINGADNSARILLKSIALKRKQISP